MIMSFSQVVPYDTNNYAQPYPGALFLTSNLASGAENIGFSFQGWNNVGMYGINAHCNYNQNGSAIIGTDHSFRASLAFAFVNYFAGDNCGMAVGGPTTNTGLPQQAGGEADCGYYGCNVQLQMSHFILNNNFWGIRANFSDSHFNEFFIADSGIAAISSFNRYTGGSTFNSGRIEYNSGNGTTIGTSSIYPTGDSLVSGTVYAGGYADWDMTDIQFENDYGPAIDVEGGGNVQYIGGHVTSIGNGTAAAPVDCEFYIGPTATGGGNLLVSNVAFGVSGGHPAYGLCGGTATSNISITGSLGSGFGVTSSFNWSATPRTLKFDNLGLAAQSIGPFGAGYNIGTALPLSGIDIGTQGLGIGSGYAGVTAAPINGAIIQGNVGIGTTVTTGSPLSLVGLGTTAPIGTTAGAGYLCVDSAGHTYQKSSCP